MSCLTSPMPMPQSSIEPVQSWVVLQVL